jgi:oligoendopeptidase F
MNLLPFGPLKPYRPRGFVPERFDFSDWSQIEPLFDRLESEAAACLNPEAFTQWLLNWGELSAALDEESARRYIAMTCHTDEAEAEKSYLQFLEEIEPRLKPRQFALSKIYLSHPVRPLLPQDRFEVFDRDTRVAVELFRDENVPLETEESKLGQQYQKLTGSLTVNFRGEERTLAQMARYLEEPDRALREEAWTLVANRRLLETDKIEALFDQLVRLREKIATNAGFAHYRDYAFQSRGRFDYSPEDCIRFHEAVEKEIVPVTRELQGRRRRQLNVPTLRPWDLAVDPLDRPPLRPFEEVEQLLEKTGRIFSQVDKELAGDFQLMGEKGLLDLANRKGKAPGGYQCSLSEARLPFIFMNAVGLQRDVETLLHEAGHAFHALAAREEDLHAYRHGPIEFCEVASMSMELLGNDYLEAFYPPEEADRARQDHLEGILKFFPWMATIDAFQHWIYTHPGHEARERTEAWLDLMNRFGDDLDWTGFEPVRTHLWHRQLHLFLHPFYYVEYGIAQLGALQVWARSRQDKAAALQSYRQALALGGSRPLPELFQAAGCRFDFSVETVRPLIGMVREELERLQSGDGRISGDA